MIGTKRGVTVTYVGAMHPRLLGIVAALSEPARLRDYPYVDGYDLDNSPESVGILPAVVQQCRS